MFSPLVEGMLDASPTSRDRDGGHECTVDREENWNKKAAVPLISYEQIQT